MLFFIQFLGVTPSAQPHGATIAATPEQRAKACFVRNWTELARFSMKQQQTLGVEYPGTVVASITGRAAGKLHSPYSI
jgi:hypothetical protein